MPSTVMTPLIDLTMATSPWETMPYEIRAMIFDMIEDDNGAANYFSWQGRLPPLVAALRQLSVSYGHVLEWLEKYSSEIYMDHGHGYSLADWNETELKVIKKLDIESSDLLLWRMEPHGNTNHSSSQRPDFNTTMKSATNLREVRLRFECNQHSNYAYIAPFITLWPLWLEGCSALSVVTVEIPLASGLVTSESRNSNLDGLVTAIAQKVGVHGQYVELIGHHISDYRELWAWEAPTGTFMNWAHEIGHEWHGSLRPSAEDTRVRIWDQFLNIRLEERDRGFVLEGLD